MKAAVCTRYGPPEVLQVCDVDDPVPGSKDVVIRIRAAAVTASDVFIRSAIPSGRLVMRLMLRVFVGFRRPRHPILGAVLAGEIESIGKHVTRFRVGDRVWAFTLLRFGCYAQRIRLPETTKLLAPAPSNLTDDEAAALRLRAQREGRSMQDVARAAVREYIDRTSRRELLDSVLDEELPRYAEALRRLGE